VAYLGAFWDLVSVLGIIFCIGLMFSLPWLTWARFGIWLVIGLVIYFTYSQRYSVLAREEALSLK